MIFNLRNSEFHARFEQCLARNFVSRFFVHERFPIKRCLIYSPKSYKKTLKNIKFCAYIIDFASEKI